jgi:hypothetical protein
MHIRSVSKTVVCETSGCLAHVRCLAHVLRAKGRCKISQKLIGSGVGTVALAGVRVEVGWRSLQSDPASPE